jgi:1-acyl-sn-glycerol-3-phosphate acyltransferase
MIAVKAKVDILPCYIRTKKNRFSFFRRVDVYFGKPIKFEDLNYDPEATGEYARISSLMFEGVCEICDRVEAEAKNGK